MHEKKSLGLGKKILLGVGIFFAFILVVGIIGVALSPPADTRQQDDSTAEQSDSATAGQDITSSNEFTVGDKVRVGDNVYVVNEIFTTPVIGSGYVSRAADGIFVVVGLSVENTGKSTAMVSTERFHIVDSQDRRYGWSSDSIYLGTMGVEPISLFKELGPGLTTSGYLAFDVPADDRGLVLEISDTFAGKNHIKLGDVENI